MSVMRDKTHIYGDNVTYIIRYCKVEVVQISFSVEEALVEKIDIAAKRMNVSRSSLIAMLLKWSIERSPFLREGKLVEGIEQVPATKGDITQLRVRIEKLEKIVEKMAAEVYAGKGLREKRKTASNPKIGVKEGKIKGRLKAAAPLIVTRRQRSRAELAQAAKEVCKSNVKAWQETGGKVGYPRSKCPTFSSSRLAEKRREIPNRPPRTALEKYRRRRSY